MKLPKIGIGLLFALSLNLVPSGDALAQDGTWQFRLRGIAIVPDESASIDPIGGDAEIDEAIVPELDVSYLFTPNVSAELVLTTAKHDVTATGTSLGDVDLGSIWLLPPTLLLQYRFAPEAAARPYVGAGVNLTLFLNEDLPPAVVTDIDYETALGFALQGGVDIPIGENGWFVNLDVKKLFLSTDVEINDASILADVDIDPWVFGAGVGLIVQ